MKPGSQQLAEFPSVCTSHTPSPAANQGLRPTIRDFVCAINRSMGNSCRSRCKDKQSPALERDLLLVGASCRDSIAKWEGEFFLKATEEGKCGLGHRHTGVNQSDGPAGGLHSPPMQNALLRAWGASTCHLSLQRKPHSTPQNQNFLQERVLSDLWSPSWLKFAQVHRKA